MVMVRKRAELCLAALGLALSCGACSLMFPTSQDQCASDSDCAARGANFASLRCSPSRVCVADDNFACAGSPPASPDPSKTVTVSVRYTDFSTGAPPTNTLVRLCATTDSNCANARGTLEGARAADAGVEGGAGWVVPNADGTVSAKVEYGFEGFFETRAPQYPPTYRATSPALTNPQNLLQQLLLRPAEIAFLADSALGKSGLFDAVGHGLVFVLARDCNGALLDGASFTTSAKDPSMKLFYVINSAPSIEDTKTDTFGRGGFLNVPPGLHTFTGYLGEGDSKKRFGSGRVLVRAGAATTIAIAPTQ